MSFLCSLPLAAQLFGACAPAAPLAVGYVEGEYVRMNEATDDRNLAALLRSEHDLTPTGVGDLRVYVPMSGHSEAQNPEPFKIPISELQPEVIADILEFSEPQVRLFGTIIDRATRQPQPAPDGEDAW